MKQQSLRDQLLSATSAAEIRRLLALGDTYIYRSPRTIRRWKKAAEQARERLRVYEDAP